MLSNDICHYHRGGCCKTLWFGVRIVTPLYVSMPSFCLALDLYRHILMVVVLELVSDIKKVVLSNL